MAITQALCLTYKEDLFNGVHEAADVYKLALFTSAAALDKNTAAYSGQAGEVANGNGYTTGGKDLTGRVVGASADIRYLSFDDPVWAAASFTARGGLIYNDTQTGKPALAVVDFGADITSTNGNWTANLPDAGATALLRIP